MKCHESMSPASPTSGLFSARPSNGYLLLQQCPASLFLHPAMGPATGCSRNHVPWRSSLSSSSSLIKRSRNKDEFHIIRTYRNYIAVTMNSNSYYFCYYIFNTTCFIMIASPSSITHLFKLYTNNDSSDSHHPIPNILHPSLHQWGTPIAG